MPTYEYQCQKCDELFEAFQSITEKPIKKCPACGGTVKRLIGSGSGLIFKGSGFYITDYKKKETQPKSAKIKEKPSSETRKKKTNDNESIKSQGTKK